MAVARIFPEMRTADFEFELPPELIAQSPAVDRDASRLLVLNRQTRELQHAAFKSIHTYLRPGDVLVLNDSRVIPARLRGLNARSGGQFEVMLLEEVAVNEWWAMLRPGKRARLGTRIEFRARDGAHPRAASAVVLEINEEGHRRLQFEGVENILRLLPEIGEVPLPPYIARPHGVSNEDAARYQTVYARQPGSVAAPTAGLHFTPALLEQAQNLGVQVRFVTLHVGFGTFAPVKAERIEEHRMHEERFTLPAATADAINAARLHGGRVFAAGTTTLRVLETVGREQSGPLGPASGRTDIFVHPPCHFRVVDALLTNFHLPCSTLLMLVSAFASPGDVTGRSWVLSAYAEAVRRRYRFFSYGDAMLVL